RRRDRARHEIAVGRLRMAHRDVAEAVDHALRGEDAAGGREVGELLGGDAAAGLGDDEVHACPFRERVFSHLSRPAWAAVAPRTPERERAAFRRGIPCAGRRPGTPVAAGVRAPDCDAPAGGSILWAFTAQATR